MVEWLVTGMLLAKQSSLRNTTGSPTDHIQLNWFSGLICIKSLSCRREMETRFFGV